MSWNFLECLVKYIIVIKITWYDNFTVCHGTFEITYHIIEVVDGGGRGSIEGAYIKRSTAS